MKRSTWIILAVLAVVGLIVWTRRGVTGREVVQGTGDWVSVLGGTETVLPNYSGL